MLMITDKCIEDSKIIVLKIFLHKEPRKKKKTLSSSYSKAQVIISGFLNGDLNYVYDYRQNFWGADVNIFVELDLIIVAIFVFYSGFSFSGFPCLYFRVPVCKLH
ncbi:hypothetical protein K501DRAFT_267276 [Backusella circina FSU 941]|nr:hypothetical protein K501DRAFT_267276 [Backusella circina FSU 941]